MKHENPGRSSGGYLVPVAGRPATSDDSVMEVLEDHIAELTLLGTTLTKQMGMAHVWGDM